jgi:hypothetical protein
VELSVYPVLYFSDDDSFTPSTQPVSHTYTVLEGSSLGSDERTIPTFSSINGDIDRQGSMVVNKLRPMKLLMRVRGDDYSDLLDNVGALQRMVTADEWYLHVRRNATGSSWDKFNGSLSSPFVVPTSRVAVVRFRLDVELNLLVEPGGD